MRKMLLFRAVLAAALIQPFAAHAETPAQKIKVATRILPPFVMRDDGGKLTGFSVELWEQIAARSGLASEFVVADDIHALLALVKDGRADLGVAAISINAERGKSFDFSQPMFEGGLRIAAPQETAVAPSVVETALNFVVSRSFLEILLTILCLMLLPAPVIWLFERNSGEKLLDAKTSLGQFGQACWWSICSLAGQAQGMPSKLIGRIIAVPWLMFTVVFSSYFTAAVTTRMTVAQLHDRFESPNDLPGHRIATVAESTAALWLRERRVKTREFPDIDAALAALFANKAEAVVYDEPILAYFAAHEMKDRIQLMGATFQPQHYGFVFRPNALLRRQVDQALLEMRESGAYAELRRKYFAETRN
jgi:polar amino acid transport system substrate-binding protein